DPPHDARRRIAGAAASQTSRAGLFPISAMRANAPEANMKHGSNKVLVGALFLALGSGTALAHHGWSWYGTQDFTLTAKVVETDFGNPHDRLVVEADGQQWTLLLSPPARSRRAGLSADLVQVGDTVTAHGH